MDGIAANEKRIHELAEANISIVTALAPTLGYDKAAALAKEAFKTGDPLRTVIKRHNLMSDDELEKALDQFKMTEPSL